MLLGLNQKYQNIKPWFSQYTWGGGLVGRVPVNNLSLWDQYQYLRLS